MYDAQGGLSKALQLFQQPVKSPFTATSPGEGWQETFAQDQARRQQELGEYANQQRQFRDQLHQGFFPTEQKPEAASAPAQNTQPASPVISDQVAQTIPSTPAVTPPATAPEQPQALPTGQPRSFSGVQQPQPGQPWWQQPLTQQTVQPTINALRGSSDISSSNYNW